MARPDAIVVGGGIVGAACARELARAGLAVTLIDGGFIGGGATSAGISLSPHVSNLITAVQTVPALKGLNLQLNSSSDCADEAGGIPGWLYGAMGVFALMAMTGMIVAFTRRREVVRVVDGPFNDFTGVVESVNYEKSRLQVAVQILGRSTPVELDFLQVEKL